MCGWSRPSAASGKSKEQQHEKAADIMKSLPIQTAISGLVIATGIQIVCAQSYTTASAINNSGNLANGAVDDFSALSGQSDSVAAERGSSCLLTGEPCFQGIDPDIYQMPLFGVTVASGRERLCATTNWSSLPPEAFDVEGLCQRAGDHGPSDAINHRRPIAQNSKRQS